MTATLHKLGAGSAAGLYYTNDSARECRPSHRDEYYARDGGGVWWSSGESVVRHGAVIDLKSFRELCAGRDPGTGKALVRGAGEGHWAGMDITFTPGKSVSVLWMAGTPEQRAFIERAHGLAVDRALRFVLDEGLIVVRRGAGGVEKAIPSDLIVAQFAHFTTREGDPNIHTHCVCMNVAGAPRDSAGSTRYAAQHLTTDPEKLYSWQKVVGSAYRASLSEQLATLGMSPRPAGRGQWEVAGLPQALLEVFSKRSHQVEDAVGRSATAAQKQIAALQTRGSKEDVPTGPELERRWREELSATTVDLWERALSPTPEPNLVPDIADERERDVFLDPPEISRDGPVASAASALFRHESVIDRRQLFELALVDAALEKSGPDRVYAELADLEADGDLIRLSVGVWTTPSIAACEAAMLRAADRGNERDWITADALATALERAAHLTAEQRDAVRQGARSDGVSIIEAGAGTGKTTLAQVLVGAAELSGLKVLGLAPSWVAADELSRSTGIPAVAIARWRYDQGQGPERSLDASTLIVVDEAGMTGTRDMSAILTAAKDAGAKVVLVGDRRQLASVSGASALKALSDILQRNAVLEGVRRQTVEWQRAASVLMARGDSEAGLRAYAANDRLDWIAGEAQARQKVIALWTDQRARHGDDVLIVTRRNADCSALNRAARVVLKSEGRLKGEEFEVPALDREDNRASLTLAIGDQVRFGETLPHLSIRNGNRAVVESLRSDPEHGIFVKFVLEDGRVVEGPWQTFARERPGRKKPPPPRMVHAYAGTAYAAQGRTAAASVLYVARSTDAREVYVGLTRHSQEVRIVVESERLAALCRQRQADHRIPPTTTALAERLFTEARQYREKANVVDFCEDRAAFTRTGHVALPARETSKGPMERAILAARVLRDALAWLEPSRLAAQAWRLLRRATTLSRALPPDLEAIVEKAHVPTAPGKDRTGPDPSYDR